LCVNCKLKILNYNTMKKTVMLFLFFGLTYSYCQTIKTSTSLYFSSDKYELSNKNKKNLKAFLDSIPQNDTNRIVRINSILIRGNTDNDADSLYNIELSKKRDLSVSDFLNRNGIKTKNIKEEYFGENRPISPNDKPEGKQKNRRVDIYISYSVINDHPKEILIEEKKNVIQDTCTKDTTVILIQGTSFTINLCEYIKIKDSLKITEYFTPQSIKESGLTTLTETGDQLYTAGMWDFKFPKDTCLKKPLIIRVPVDSCLKNYKMSLWYGQANGRWINARSRGVKIVTIGNQKYYQFKVLCPGKLNLDVYARKPSRTYFKAKNRIKLKEIFISWDCPRSVISINDNKPVKRLKGNIGKGLGEASINVTGIGSKGDTLKITNKKLSSLKYKGFLFKRYLIYRKDFGKNR